DCNCSRRSTATSEWPAATASTRCARTSTSAPADPTRRSHATAGRPSAPPACPSATISPPGRPDSRRIADIWDIGDRGCKDPCVRASPRWRQRMVALQSDGRAAKLGPLVKQLAQAAGADTRDGELLLDVAVDGIRCVLVRAGDDAGTVALTPREEEIVRLVAEGHPNKIIAAELDISAWTVGTHLRRIFAKLGVASRAAMVARTAVSWTRA